MSEFLEEVITPTETESRLVVIFKTASVVKVNARGLEPANEDVAPLQAVLDRHKASLTLLFGQDENRLRRDQADVLGASAEAGESPNPAEEFDADDTAPSNDGNIPDLASFYYVDGEVGNLESLAAELNQHDLVDAAYITPPTSQPLLLKSVTSPEDMEVPAITPNFTSRQIYLGPAPGGVDAKYAHTVPGGRGEGFRVGDVERGWRFTHEDLRVLQGGVISGTNAPDNSHGTAVCGVVSGDVNNIGILGIAPDSVFYGSSYVGNSVAAAIKAAADRLRSGDVILLEVHRPGPNTPNPPSGQKGYIAVEWWPEDFAAIRYAVNKGIVVVEAAGNGEENLNAAIYNTRPAGFPNSWRNPFNVLNPSSGAIIVGAGCPPPGTHGRNHGPDRSRLSFSNYGSRVDCQGWGREVTTTGYGDLQGGQSADLWYTDIFNGTSSASPMAVGVVLCVQGVRKKKNKLPLSSARYRTLLRQTGSPQQAGPGAPVSQRIGNRPDLRKLIPAALNLP
ncbi:serine protease [Akanthomyces lecanii RCEF 1005]|uniref:Serine protease n=1 Tax=Akanthomyces lecanii RCEF 1005 TaxID=1081108 RepID=A0A168IB77_CORDF|nr:serine protease [Akanthomyces lecanii RCEF 1005]